MNLHVNRNTHLDWDHSFTQLSTQPVGSVPLQITVLKKRKMKSSHLVFMTWELFIWSGTLTFNPQRIIMHESYWSDQKLTTTHSALLSRCLALCWIASISRHSVVRVLSPMQSNSMPEHTHLHSPAPARTWIYSGWILYYCSKSFIHAVFKGP